MIPEYKVGDKIRVSSTAEGIVSAVTHHMLDTGAPLTWVSFNMPVIGDSVHRGSFLAEACHEEHPIIKNKVRGARRRRKANNGRSDS